MNRLIPTLILVTLFFATEGIAAPYQPKETLRVTGSTTVAPFVLGISGLVTGTTQVFVNETGTGAGIASVCNRIGNSVDATGASRKIKSEELQRCAAVGIDRIVEVSIGFDGIVLAQSNKSDDMELTARDIYLAVARNVPRDDNQCVMISNRRKYWSDVRSGLPKRPILFIGPSTGSGTRQMFGTLIMQEGARQIPCLASVETRSPAFFKAALEIRTDGAWVDGGEHDHAVAHSLLYLKHAVGLFGFSHLSDVEDVSPISIDGILPSRKTIGDRTYLATRPLYLYATEDRLRSRPILVKFFATFSTPSAIASNGVLTGLGLVGDLSDYGILVIETRTGQEVKVEGGMSSFLSPPS